MTIFSPFLTLKHTFQHVYQGKLHFNVEIVIFNIESEIFVNLI